MSTKKRALGRGLSALLENAETDVTQSSGTPDNSKTAGSVSMLAIENIEPNPFQPRMHFSEEALQELSESIREHGIIQPVTVRKMGYGKYQLISGERRFRASQMAGLTELPAYIRIANDQAMLELALVENVQRQDLDPIEVAVGYKRLIDECELTQEQLAERVSKSRSGIANHLRLLKLPVEIQVALKEQVLTMGHARALINIADTGQQREVFNLAIDHEWSVRQLEEYIRTGVATTSTKKSERQPVERKQRTALPHEFKQMRKDLAEYLDAKVDLKRDEEGQGKLTIGFDSDEDLDRILNLLQG